MVMRSTTGAIGDDKGDEEACTFFKSCLLQHVD